MAITSAYIHKPINLPFIHACKYAHVILCKYTAPKKSNLYKTNDFTLHFFFFFYKCKHFQQHEYFTLLFSTFRSLSQVF